VPLGRITRYDLSVDGCVVYSGTDLRYNICRLKPGTEYNLSVRVVVCFTCVLKPFTLKIIIHIFIWPAPYLIQSERIKYKIDRQITEEALGTNVYGGTSGPQFQIIQSSKKI